MGARNLHRNGALRSPGAQEGLDVVVGHPRQQAEPSGYDARVGRRGGQDRDWSHGGLCCRDDLVPLRAGQRRVWPGLRIGQGCHTALARTTAGRAECRLGLLGTASCFDYDFVATNMTASMVLPFPQYQARTENRDSSYGQEQNGEKTGHVVKCTRMR